MTEADRIRDYFGTASWRPRAGSEYLAAERTALLHAIAAGLGKPTEDLSLCDVGCGGGADLVRWRDAGIPERHLAGTELMLERAESARRTVPAADVRIVDGFDLPFASDSFDICTASLVLSTVRDAAQRGRLLAEMARVTAPGGIVIVYDFRIRKPWNRNVRAVTAGELTRLWRAPDEIHRAAPFLPALDIALRLPRPIGRWMIRLLPRTHRLWIWRSR